MQTIWKYEVGLNQAQLISMPAGAKIRYLGVQDRRITLWAEVISDQKMIDRLFVIVGTGQDIEDACNLISSQHRAFRYSEARSYIGTVQIDEFVWHVYEIHVEED